MPLPSQSCLSNPSGAESDLEIQGPSTQSAGLFGLVRPTRHTSLHLCAHKSSVSLACRGDTALGPRGCHWPCLPAPSWLGELSHLASATPLPVSCSLCLSPTLLLPQEGPLGSVGQLLRRWASCSPPSPFPGNRLTRPLSPQLCSPLESSFLGALPPCSPLPSIQHPLDRPRCGWLRSCCRSHPQRPAGHTAATSPGPARCSLRCTTA